MVQFLQEAVGRSSFIFVNADELLDFPRLTSQKVIYVGGIAVPKPMPLKDEYYEIMEKRKEGVVLVAFGTVAQSSSMSLEMKNAFLALFQTFPKITFIWKYEEENGSTVLNLGNLVVKNFVPQNDLLRMLLLRIFL
ncbi:unnamed protein product [Gongylonema pulchrum]|uniref:glucuronosyltransferase n=1 Tax=Gongylonema pulchrum TaxID=637853 RepID=A0A183DV63_9BILA|nr:unnamed protein product [Gongylonema pulchrum]